MNGLFRFIEDAFNGLAIVGAMLLLIATSPVSIPCAIIGLVCRKFGWFHKF